jgi:hypothetical protein
MIIRTAGQTFSERSARLKRFLLRILWKSIGVGVSDFLLVGLWGPNLVNRHQNSALAGAILCLLAALFATGWLLLQLWQDIGLLNHRAPRGTLTHHRTLED